MPEPDKPTQSPPKPTIVIGVSEARCPICDGILFFEGDLGHTIKVCENDPIHRFALTH